MIVRLDRPKVNAIDVDTSHALHAAFERLQHDSSLRVAILTGAGERFFSAGWDLKAAVSGEPVDADHGPGGFGGLTEFFNLGKPVIAAVNGLALGGGFELALAADLVVAAQQAEFGLPEVQLGMVPDSGGVIRLPRRLPRAVAAEMLLTGHRMSAPEAHRWGLVNRLAHPSALMDEALRLATEICAGAPLAVAAVKEIMVRTESLGVEEAFRQMRSGELSGYQLMLRSEDAGEGPRAFTESRDPRWRGV